ncbi:enolase C-terminal domain-like protein [Parafrankia discariae]|uniref:enolase C-terminal domain-like protein n=1 Tax=Parafrankia discariae TaxID=365528 RepID=UPI00055337D8|nr:enolase C-terminal domain-like protein [Parafrankia discariae]
MTAKITRVRAVTLAGPDFAPGDETQFVVVASDDYDGWYGPIPAVFTPRLVQMFTRCLVGRPVEDHDDLQHRIQAAVTRNALARSIARWAVGALDCAGWDLHGRIVGRPVAELLTAEAAESVPLYASHLSVELVSPDIVAERQDLAAAGFRLTKWSLRQPPTGASEPLLAAMRRLMEDAPHPLAFDGHGTWSAESIPILGELSRADHLWWLEDLLSTSTAGAYRNVASTNTKVAVGERLVDVPAAIQIVRETAVSTLTPDVVWLGGITPTTRLLRDTNFRKLPVFLHGRAYLPALQVAAAFDDTVGAVEFRIQWEPRRQRLYQRPSLPRQGAADIGGVGLGGMPDLAKYQCTTIDGWERI